MSLPSQMPRSGMSVPRLSGGRRRRRGRGKGGGPLLLVVAAVVIAVAYWLWPSRGPEEASAGVAPSEEPTRQALQQPQPKPERERREQASHLGASAQRSMAESSGTPVTRPPESPAASSTPRSMEMGSPASEPITNVPEAELEREVIETAPDALSNTVLAAIRDADAQMARNRPVKARDLLNRAMHDPRATATEVEELRARLATIAEQVTFSPRVYPDDSTADTYVVQRGDSLSTIPRQAGFNIDYRLVQRINQISDPRRLGMGQRIKGLYGPFHAVVHKSAFRLDVYTDQRDSAGNRIYIRSFPVGLGEYGSTPIGSWVVAEGKVLNPGWRNPRTGEVFDKDDPLNPIGERWIGLEGTDENTALESGYGIHGTVEPESIGREMSMGCVRMLADDVALMFELLVPGRSTVEIVP